MNNKYIAKNSWLITKITVAATVAFAIGCKLQKGRQNPKRSTKPADDLTMDAFDAALSKGITFRAARQELENTKIVRPYDANTQQGHNQVPMLEAAFNSLKQVLSPRAKV